MNGFISIRQIMDDLLDHPLLKNITFERVIKLSVDFMRIVGVPPIFEEKVTTVHIDNYRAELPCDLYEIIQIRTTTDKCGRHHTHTFKYSTDNFHMAHYDSRDLTYKVQGRVLFASIEHEDVEMSYRAIKTDSEGYPMIPDSPSFVEALELYIKKYYFRIEFEMGKITPQVYQSVQQDYAWAVGQASTDLIRPSLDQMESLTNSLNALVARVVSHDTGFINEGSREYIRKH